MRNSKTKFLLTAAIYTGLGSSVALAQAIETVVVTAEKRERDVQKVAMSIDVQTAEELETFGVGNFQALDSYVPNLLYQKSPSNAQIFIRGFGSQAVNAAFDQSVSLYVDSIYGGRVRQFMAPFFDVERIEVMRGPQGALLGKNTAAGAVSIITANPSDVFEAEATALYNFDREGFELGGFITGPLSDTLTGRFAFQYTDMDGFIENLFDNSRVPTKKDIMGRASLRFEPTSDIDITAKLELGDFHSDGTIIVRRNPITGAIQTTKNSGPQAFGIAERDHQNNIGASVNANFGGIFGDHTLNLIGGYSHFIMNNAAGGAPRAPAQNWASVFREKFDQYSIEARLLSPTGQTLEYIVGVYWDHSDFYQRSQSSYQNPLGLPFSGQIHHDYNQGADTWSAFALATWNVTDDLRLMGSARFTNNSKEATFINVTDFGVPLNGPQNITRSKSEDNFDPSVTVQYDVMEDVMAYFTYGRGSKAGGFNANRSATPTNFEFGGEVSTNYEIGMKSKWFDGSVLLNVALFRLNFEDLQVSAYNPVLATFITANAAAATSEGVELEASWLVTEDFQIDTGLAFLEAYYDDFPGGACAVPPIQPATCVAPTNNLKGFRIPGVSRWSGNIRATYKHDLTEDLLLTLVGGMNFRSTFNTTTDYSPIYGTQPTYAKFDFRIQVSDAVNDRWEVALIGKNVTDEVTSNFAFLWPIEPTGPTANAFLQEFQAFMLEGKLRFGGE